MSICFLVILFLKDISESKSKKIYLNHLISLSDAFLEDIPDSRERKMYLNRFKLELLSNVKLLSVVGTHIKRRYIYYV